MLHRPSISLSYILHLLFDEGALQASSDVPCHIFYVEFQTRVKVEPLEEMEIVVQVQIGRLQCKAVNYDEWADFALTAVSL